MGIFRLLYLEWKKLKTNRTFWALSILYASALPLFFLMGKGMSVNGNRGDASSGPNPAAMMDSSVFYKFPEVWDYLGYLGNWLNFFVLGFIGVLIVTNDITYKTMRQNIITGMSRNEYFTGKILILLTLSLGATLYYCLLGLGFGFVHTEGTTFQLITQNADLIPRFFLQCVAYGSFAFFLGWLFKRTALALILYIVYVMFLEMAIRWMGHANVLPNKSMHFYPMNAAEDLVPMPLWFAEPMMKGLEENLGFSYFLTSTEAVITSAIYIIIFLVLSFIRFKKMDL